MIGTLQIVVYVYIIIILIELMNFISKLNRFYDKLLNEEASNTTRIPEREQEGDLNNVTASSTSSESDKNVEVTPSEKISKPVRRMIR